MAWAGVPGARYGMWRNVLPAVVRSRYTLPVPLASAASSVLAVVPAGTASVYFVTACMVYTPLCGSTCPMQRAVRTLRTHTTCAAVLLCVPAWPTATGMCARVRRVACCVCRYAVTMWCLARTGLAARPCRVVQGPRCQVAGRYTRGTW